MSRRSFILWLALNLMALACSAQNDTVPPELARAFDRYSRAWKNKDWSTTFDIQSSVHQEQMIKKFGSKEKWMKQFEQDFADTLTSLEREKSWNLGGGIHTFSVVFKGYHANRQNFVIHNYVTFQWNGNDWFLVETVYPKEKSKR